jgi:hypothetical protein
MVDTSDFILLVAALFIFAILQLGYSGTLLRNSSSQVESELEYSGLALAQNLVEESRTMAFDEVRVGPYVPVSNPGELSSIGSDAGEVYPHFDDFDDFNQFSRSDTTQDGVYNVKAWVDYVNPDNVREVSTTKTFVKRMRVQVVSEIGDTVAVSYVRKYY